MVKVISLPCIFQVLYVLCFGRPRYQVSVHRTIGPLVLIMLGLIFSNRVMPQIYPWPLIALWWDYSQIILTALACFVINLLMPPISFECFMLGQVFRMRL